MKYDCDSASLLPSSDDLRGGHKAKEEGNTRVRERGRSISLKRPTAEIKTNEVRDAHARAHLRA